MGWEDILYLRAGTGVGADNDCYHAKAGSEPAGHPERSEGSDAPGPEILRCAQDDMTEVGR